MHMLLPLLLLASCSFFKKKDNERMDGHHRLYSAPEAEEAAELPPHQKRVVVVATNDWKGELEPAQEGAKDRHQPQEVLVSVGGAEVFARHLEILRRAHGGEVLLLDAGGGFGTGKGAQPDAAVVEARQRLGYDAAAFSGGDLVLHGPPAGWVPRLLKKGSTPVLMANLLDLHTTEPVTWPGVLPHLVKEVGGVKVGLVGLYADDVPRTEGKALNGLYVEPAMQALLKQARALRLKGAQLVVALMHGGVVCGRSRAEKLALPLAKVNFEPRDATACDPTQGIAPFLLALPPGLVDAVVTGGGEGKGANWINGIAVLQAPGGAKAFSRADLVYDEQTGRLAESASVVHQPVRLCHRFFKATEDCYTGDPSMDHREMAPARYLGEAVTPEPATASWMESWRLRSWTAPAEDLVDVQAAAPERAP